MPGTVIRVQGRAQPGVAVPQIFRGIVVNKTPAPPRGVSHVWQIKDFKPSNFGSVASTGVMGDFFGCVAIKGVRGSKGDTGGKGGKGGRRSRGLSEWCLVTPTGSGQAGDP